MKLHLIIGEVSFLLDRELLKLDRTLQRIGDKSKPFGGYGIIFSGDVQQKEPVRMRSPEKFWHPTSSRHFEIEQTSTVPSSRMAFIASEMMKLTKLGLVILINP